MTTNPPTSPTVEKWERDFDEKFGDPDAIAAKNAYGDDVYYKYHIEYMPDSLIKDFIRTLLSHSVQEAKAERDEEWKKIIACHNCNGTGRTDNIGGAMECIECGGQCHNLVRYDGIHIDDLLSTLTTKEDK